ncbi:DNA mismatch repair protein MutS [Umbelopsis sp. PMI_123]|nr:DNA mismatch repair protein MutS [Umbelopsis sp. PMI_123]
MLPRVRLASFLYSHAKHCRIFTDVRTNTILYAHSRRPFISSWPCSKRVTKGDANEILARNSKRETPPAFSEAFYNINTEKIKGSTNESKESFKIDSNDPLPILKAPTGSVVLDAVREYTEKYPTCVLLMQVGDFYELYEQHAADYASQLDLKLTKKEITTGTIVHFAGFPARSLDRYLDMLVNRVKANVALCEQYTTVSGHIKRKITRIITPGTLVEEQFLDAHEYNYLLAINIKDQSTGLAWLDMSVGDFNMQSSDLMQLEDDLARIRPREILLPSWLEHKVDHPVHQILQKIHRSAVTFRPNEMYDAVNGKQTLSAMTDQWTDLPSYTTKPNLMDLEPELESPTFSDMEIAAAEALIDYVDNTQLGRHPRLQRPIKFDPKEVLRIDSSTMTSLEILSSIREGKRADSLLGIIDCTTTSAGSRLLNRWLVSPLNKVESVEKRLDIVEYFYDRNGLLENIRLALKSSNDAQRALQRLSLRKGQHNDLLELKWTFQAMKTIKHQILQNLQEEKPNATHSDTAKTNHAVSSLLDTLDTHDHLVELIIKAIDEEYVLTRNTRDYRDYGYVNMSYNKKLQSAHQKLMALEHEKALLYDRLRTICGSSVTLMSSSAFKHVVEVGNRHAQKLKDAFHATLVNQTRTKHRYQIEEWTKLSVDIENTAASIIELEAQVYEQLCEIVLEQSNSIIRSCRAFAQLDVLSSFAKLATDNNFVRPNVNDGNTMHIIGGRHPVVEAGLYHKGRQFIKNDCDIHDKESIWLLTGPNMGGKSTFLRQVAVILLLAQIGCYVPAKRADIGIADRIFSRVGASDNVAQNQSTFMVEMLETANILKNATSKSFVIMDEVGRGTATDDGLSLAYAILHYLHEKVQCRSLFATHYHDLADMLQLGDFNRLSYYKTTIEEDAGGGYIFNHRISPGVCRKSHGIKVAQIAGLPEQVISLAYQTMARLEDQRTQLHGHIRPSSHA